MVFTRGRELHAIPLCAACIDAGYRRSDAEENCPRDEERRGDHSNPPLPIALALRYPPHNAPAQCRRRDFAVMRPTNDLLERHHAVGKPGTGNTDVKVPADLQLAFADQFTVDQRNKLLKGWTMGHRFFLRCFRRMPPSSLAVLPHRRRTGLESSHKLFQADSDVDARVLGGNLSGR